MSAQVVDCTAPDRFLERLGAEVEGLAIHNLVGPHVAQVLRRRVRLAGDGGGREACAFQNGERDAAHSPGRARDRDGPMIGDLMVLLHSPHRHGGGESRRAQRHRLEQAEPRGQRHDRLRRDAGELRKTAVERFAEVAPGDEHAIAPREAPVDAAFDHTRQIDAGGAHRPPRNRRVAGHRQRVLVIETRVGDADNHLAWGEIIERHRIEPRSRAALDPVYAQCCECGHANSTHRCRCVSVVRERVCKSRVRQQILRRAEHASDSVFSALIVDKALSRVNRFRQAQPVPFEPPDRLEL